MWLLHQQKELSETSSGYVFKEIDPNQWNGKDHFVKRCQYQFKQRYNSHSGIDTFTVRLQMDGLKDRKVIPLNIVSAKKLFTVIHKENKKANIRINQIEIPDSTFDGPFGDSLHYKIKMNGVYKIIVGPDLMATGKLDGVFELKKWTK